MPSFLFHRKIPRNLRPSQSFILSDSVRYFSCLQTGGVNLSKLEGTRGTFALRQACNDMLTSLPHALATICDLWTVIRSKEEPVLPLGSPQVRDLVYASAFVSSFVLNANSISSFSIFASWCSICCHPLLSIINKRSLLLFLLFG